MKKIKFMVKGKFYNLYLTNNGEKALIYMGYKREIKDLKNRTRYAIMNNEQNRNIGQYICSYHFISSFLENGSFKLVRLNENEFIFEEMGCE